MIKPSIWNLLACPACGAPLEQRNNGAVCSRCRAEYGGSEQQLDLRLHSPRTYTLDFDLQAPLLPPNGFDFGHSVRMQRPKFPSLPRSTSRNSCAPEID